MSQWKQPELRGLNELGEPIITHHRTKPLRTQAERVFDKFGGVQRLAKILQMAGEPYNRSSLYRWGYPRSKNGQGGVVPASAWPALRKAARLDGIVLGPEEFDVREL